MNSLNRFVRIFKIFRATVNYTGNNSTSVIVFNARPARYHLSTKQRQHEFVCVLLSLSLLYFDYSLQCWTAGHQLCYSNTNLSGYSSLVIQKHRTLLHLQQFASPVSANWCTIYVRRRQIGQCLNVFINEMTVIVANTSMKGNFLSLYENILYRLTGQGFVFFI